MYALSLKAIEREYIETHGIVNKVPLHKVDYETLIDVEKGIL